MPPKSLDLDTFLRIPRVSGCEVSPDGRWIVFQAGRPAVKANKMVTDLWRVPASGDAPAERLTVGDVADGGARYLPDGSILFLSNRAENEVRAEEDGEAPGGKEGKEPGTRIWRLPPAGEPRILTRDLSGIDTVLNSADGKRIAFAAFVHPGVAGAKEQSKRQEKYEKDGVIAQAFEGLPMRFWDRWYGPRYRHLFVAEAGDLGTGVLDAARDLTPDASFEHDDLGFDLSPDGRHLCVPERQRIEEGRLCLNLRLFDLEAGTSRLVTSGEDDYHSPRFSPDGGRIVAVHHENVPGKHGRTRLVLLDIASGALSFLAESLDLWPIGPVFSPDGQAVFFTADEAGHIPAFRLDLAGGKVTRLSERGSYEQIAPSPDGTRLYAIGSRTASPPEVVAFDARKEGQDAERITWCTAPALEGIALRPAEETWATSKDGRRVHSWLFRPAGEVPEAGAPLLLWIHGGPLGAYVDGWHWRWQPQLYTAEGYAVLCVNPRISIGFGQQYIEEGFNRWGGEPYDDLLAAVDAAGKLPGIDGSRVAAMGGSYGGYMANWVAGHTDRFKCIVSHAGLWSLTSFHGTTDFPMEWEREVGHPVRDLENYDRWSPHRFVDKIRTPMLIIHGERDYRVAVSEGYQVFTLLQRLGVPSRLLNFPDENHWILKPRNIALWNRTIWEWLGRWV